MNKLSYTVLLLLMSSASIADDYSEFYPSSFEVGIPYVKIGNGWVYNARLKYDGRDNFRLMSYQNSSSIAIGEEYAEYYGWNSYLYLPKVKIGNDWIYGARLQYDGKDNFKLMSYHDIDPKMPSLNNPTDVESWLVRGGYKSWRCEFDRQASRPGSGHNGENRVCSNSLLFGSKSGSYPVGAASVKELWGNGRITGYAVSVKMRAGSGADTWQWYESSGGSVRVNAMAASGCEGCHSRAPRDRVYVRAD